MNRSSLATLVALAGQLAAGWSAAVAQQPADSIAQRPLATRATLEALAREQEGGSGAGSATLAFIRARLTEGDFHPGDRIVLEVAGEPVLSDTFTVEAGPELRLPSPVGAAASLRGVLRSEVEAHLQQVLGQYLLQTNVHARPLIRLSVQGEVAKAGVYNVAAGGVLSEAVMAAGGTTAQADLERVRVERAGSRLWRGKFQKLMGVGVTVDEALLHDGDQLVIPRRKDSVVLEGMRVMWLTVSLVAGVYGLSKAF